MYAFLRVILQEITINFSTYAGWPSVYISNCTPNIPFVCNNCNIGLYMINNNLSKRSWKRVIMTNNHDKLFQWPVDSPQKGPVTRKMFPFHDVIMACPYNHPHNVPCHTVELKTSLMSDSLLKDTSRSGMSGRWVVITERHTRGYPFEG